MLIFAGPNWVGSPQHVVGGAGLAFAVVLAATFKDVRGWVAVGFAVGATSTAEILIELVEYPLLYADRFHHSAYYDTLADMASTLLGGLVGAIAGWLLVRHRVTRQHRRT